jgi:D-alanine-D-alanine ligase
LIEEYIEGKELTCMVLGTKAHVVTELKPNVEFYDYEAKYTDGMTSHILPAEIPESAANVCIDYSQKLHSILGCKGISRSDFRYNEKQGVVLLEINTNPGMTCLSLVPEQAKYIGISYEKLCSYLVENARCRGFDE